MKKVFIIALAAMLIAGMMAIPAFAAGSDSYIFSSADDPHTFECTEYVPEGYYIAEFDVFIEDEGYTLRSEPFELMVWSDDRTYEAECYFTLSILGYDYSAALYLLSEDPDPVSVTFILEEEYYYVVEPDLELGSITLVPYSPSEPPATGDVMDSVGFFFSGIISWFGSLGQLLEQPLFLLSVVCIPLIGFGIWGMSKLKNS